MDTLSWIADVYGPRLTGSPTLRQAGEWARDQLTRWGLANAALEPNGTISRGWSIDRFSIEMTEPQYMRITGYPRAWSPATRVAAHRHAGRRRGEIEGRFREVPRQAARRHRHERPPRSGRHRLPAGSEAADRRGAEEAGRAGRSGRRGLSGSTPKSFWDEEDEFQKALEKQTEIYEFFAKEGVAALVTPSAIGEDVRTDGFYDHVWHPAYPGFVISREHYGRIVRMLDRKQPVKISLALAVRIVDRVDGLQRRRANCPGTDPVLKSEVVMLGGHLDSWHSGTGATDNGAGCAVALEAMRILKTIGVQPRRTIRVALWTGEEQDYFGSVGYVERHFGTLKTVALKPEHAKLSAYFNLDNGSGRIRGVNLQGNEGGAADLRRLASPVPLPRRVDADDAEHRRNRSHAVRRHRPARFSVHPGSAELRIEGAPLEPGSLRGSDAGRSEAGVSHPGELRVSRSDARRDAAAETAAEAAHGHEVTRAIAALASA